MAFYSPDPAMDQTLAAVLAALEADGRPGLGERLSITWLRYSESPRRLADRIGPEAFWQQRPPGASWGGERLRYPASVVKLVYLVAAEAWLQRRLLEDDPEWRRALADMIRHSGNDATSLVVDGLSGTTSGPALPPGPMEQWQRQRQLVNRWLEGLAWPELRGCNACQKTWAEGPYGRERQSYGAALENRNRLTTAMTARLLQAVMAGEWVSPQASTRMRELLARSLDPAERQADPENQVDGFLGEGLPTGSRLWSKAGWMSQARHDAAFCEVPGLPPFLLVAFGEGAGPAIDESWLPGLCRELVDSLKAPVSV